MKIVCVLLSLVAHMVAVHGVVEIYDYDRLFGLSNKTEEQKYMCADIVFAIDTSCSVKTRDKKKMVTVVEKVVNATKVNEKMARFGLVLFDNGARKVFGLSNNFKNADEILGLLADLRTNIKEENQGCKTHTWKALEMVRTDEDLLGSESRYDNGKERKRVLILLTDGKPYDDKNNIDEMAKLTRKMGGLNDKANITTFVVHVPSYGVLEPIPLLTDLVTELRWKIEVSNATDLEEVGHFFFHHLAKISACDYRCTAKIDLCFVMDRSDSIEIENIKLMKDFFKDLSDSFLITYDESNSKYTRATIGVSSYNQYVHQHTLGNTCKDNECVRDAIDEIPVEHETYTETYDALANVPSQCLTVQREPGIHRVAILATDGNTWKEGSNSINSRPTIAMANRLRREGIDTEVIGTPNYQEDVGTEEWEQTASHFVFDMRNNTGPGWSVSFEDLKSITGTVARKICEQYSDS